MAAGALLILEAGGLVSDMDEDNHFLKTGDIVAGNPKILTELQSLLNS